MLPASVDPSVRPAPTMLCNSSMNSSTRPSLSAISLSTALSRSSNSPRNFAPAISAPRSREKTVRSFIHSGTSPRTIRCASPSTIAVLPTPGSPMSTGLFLVLRDRMRITRRISASRPITGSSFPVRAWATRSTPYFSSASYAVSGVSLVTRWLPRTPISAARKPSRVTPACASRRPPADSFPSSIWARAKCSTETYSSFSFLASSSALTNSCWSRRVTRVSAPGPETRGRLPKSFSTSSTRSAVGISIRFSTAGKIPPSCSSSTSSRCSPSTSPCPWRSARLWAPCSASCDFRVSLFRSIAIFSLCALGELLDLPDTLIGTRTRGHSQPLLQFFKPYFQISQIPYHTPEKPLRGHLAFPFLPHWHLAIPFVTTPAINY